MPQKKQTLEQVALDLDESVRMVEELGESRGKGSAAHESEVDGDIIDAIWSDDIKKYEEAIQRAGSPQADGDDGQSEE